jgi:DNA polymerase-3 subunit alpha
MGFVNLHNHSRDGSLLDGLSSVDELARKAKELGQEALAITEHGWLGSMVKFYRACKSEGIKPILGYEAYMVDDVVQSKENKQRSMNHLVLLAKNEHGLENILKLNDFAFKSGFYYKPKIDRDSLAAHKDGLVCLSACLGGAIPQSILLGQTDLSFELIEWFKNTFHDDFYLETMDHGLAEESIVHMGLATLSFATEVPMVCTNDTHYLNKEDAHAHRVLLCSQIKQTWTEFTTPKVDKNTGEMTLAFDGFQKSDGFYLRSEQEMFEIFKNNEMLANSVEIANKCNVELKRLNPEVSPKYLFPNFETPNKKPAGKYFTELCCSGYADRVKRGDIEDTENNKKRLDYEISVISDMKFQEYFLVVRDIVNFCRESDIPVGPGRGSAAGSLASYCLGITDIDPIRYNLLFERFLDPSRVSLPDIDIDFDYARANEVIEYIKTKYGSEYVCRIGTYGTLGARTVLKDVAKVLEYPYDKINDLTKAFPIEADLTIDSVLEGSVDFAKALESDEQLQEIVKIGKKLEGANRHTSQHAAGVVISPKRLNAMIPLKDDASQLDMHDLEDYGFVKMDILRLRTLTVIDDTLKKLKEGGIKIDLRSLTYDDPEVYKEFQEGNTIGVFQFESTGIQHMLRSMRPTCFEDIIASAALYRPGPLGFRDEDTGLTMVETFCARKNGYQDVTYDHPLLEPILKNTYGVIVYQEQVMQTAVALAGYTLSESDNLRRIMGKKQIEKMPVQEQKFINGCLENGINKELAINIFNKIKTFSEYGFNRSHSAAYAVLAYQCAFLKVYYPVELMASILTSVIGNKPEEVARYLNETRRMGVEMLPPDVRKSDRFYKVDGDKIVYGLGGISGVGENAVNKIISLRKVLLKNGNGINSFYEFFEHMDMRVINSKVMNNLILTGCFDFLGHTRAALVEYYKNLSEAYQKINTKVQSNDKRKNPTINIQLFWEPLKEIPMCDIPEYPINEILGQEKSLTGLYLSGSPLEFCSDAIAPLVTYTAGTLGELGPGRNVTIGGLINSVSTTVVKKGKSKGKSMAFIELEDMEGVITVTVFSDVYEDHRTSIYPGNVCLIKGETTMYKDSINVVAKEIKSAGYNQEEQAVNDELPDSILIIMADEVINFKEIEDVRRMFNENPGKQKIVLCRGNHEPEILSGNVRVMEEIIEKIRDYEWVIDAWEGTLDEIGEVA